MKARQICASWFWKMFRWELCGFDVNEDVWMLDSLRVPEGKKKIKRRVWMESNIFIWQKITNFKIFVITSRRMKYQRTCCYWKDESKLEENQQRNLTMVSRLFKIYVYWHTVILKKWKNEGVTLFEFTTNVNHEHQSTDVNISPTLIFIHCYEDFYFL